ncbi:UNVERIFIED_ORG: hypothetical protein ABRZ91_001770 [Heyndrickxia coagulans]
MNDIDQTDINYFLELLEGKGTKKQDHDDIEDFYNKI